MKSAYCEIDLPGGVAAAHADPVELLIAERAGQIAELLDRVEALAAAGCTLIGFVGYEAAHAFDPALVAHSFPEGLPVAMFAAYRAESAPRGRHGFIVGPWRDQCGPDRFDAAIAAIRADIGEGRLYQVNYTTRLQAACMGDSLALFDALRSAQPGAHSFYLDFGRWQICSVSPELFFEWRQPDNDGRTLTVRPMKGTAARSADPAGDRDAALALRNSVKDRAENLMIVDLLRNDLARVARLGSVTVPSLFDVEPWPTVWQMTSTVSCSTRPGIRLADVFGALFPCGSVTGAPKAEAMKAITELEPSARGVYCGAVGVVRPGGDCHFNVAIRTVVVDGIRQLAECGIGSGIVSDSTATGEADEWRTKRRFLDVASPAYELFETLLWRRGRYWLRREHLARLAASATVLGFPFDIGRLERALDAAVSGFGDGHWRVRLRLDARGEVATDCEAAAAPPCEPVEVAWAARPVDSRDPRLRHKTSRRGYYDALAVTGAFDTLLFNERGEVTEFTRGNLVVRLEGRLLTPAAASGLLPGTLRDALLRRGAVQEAVLKTEDLIRVESMWFVNSVRGSLAVTFVDRTQNRA
jgi:para-aminobenzoate synthetase/4-amino-4-deoxychorismate lyase